MENKEVTLQTILDVMNSKFKQIDEKFDKIDKRLDGIDTRITRIATDNQEEHEKFSDGPT